ncbi:MAG: extracellular solute-binding protein [Eubacteriales bacterium]|nr:extracellular solute-binding protein [Eubacteriales bacterium]
MRRKGCGIMALVITISMLAGLFEACEKQDEGGTQTSGQTVTATAAKTTAKATSVSSASAVKTAVASTELRTVSAAPETETEALKTEAIEEETTEEAATDNEEVKEEAVMDLGGREVIITFHGTGQLEGDPQNAAAAVLQYMTEQAEKKYNFRVRKYNPASSTAEYTTKVVLQVISGINVGDIVNISTFSHYLPFLTKEILLPLDDYINFEEPIIKAYNFLYNFKFRDKHYVMTAGPDTALGSWTNPYNYAGMGYNRDLVSREGQPDILDLEEAGRWTWDTFLDMCIALTRDTNGDGIVDQWGCTGQSHFYFTQLMMYSNGAVPVVQRGEKYVTDLYDNKAQRALQFISDLAFVHKVVDLGYSATRYRQGRTGMYIQVAGFNAGNRSALSSSILAPLPLGPDIDDHLLVVNPTLYGILVTQPNPQEIATILKEIIVSWDMNLKLLPEYQPIVDSYPKPWVQMAYQTTGSEREYNLSYNVAGKEILIDYYAAVPNFVDTMQNILCKPIMDGTSSVAQALAASSDVLQAMIDEYVGQ